VGDRTTLYNKITEACLHSIDKFRGIRESKVDMAKHLLWLSELAFHPATERKHMKITRKTYDSPVDALIAVAKHISLYEKKYSMDSETFFHKYRSGQMEDTEDMIEWSNNYQHYIQLKADIERQLRHAA
jgi:hypothetical protein